jgi:N-acetylneuraminic acid mutarotase
MAKARYTHTAILLSDGRVLVGGGIGSNGFPTNSAELYDPDTGTWSATGSMITPCYGHTATLLTNGNVLIAGGLIQSNVILNSAELYNPASGNWTATGLLKAHRANHTATLLSNGQVLIAGGYSSFYSPLGIYLMTASVEQYDPVVGTWKMTNSMTDYRANHAATILRNGMVLVVGGDHGDILNSAELYDPSTGTWTATIPMNTPRHLHSVTLLANGGVLATAGYSGSYLSSSELYGLPFALTPALLQNGSFCFSFTNIHGLAFAIMTTTNVSLPMTNWQEIGGVIETSLGQFQFTDCQATNGGQRFYRVVSQ